MDSSDRRQRSNDELVLVVDDSFDLNGLGLTFTPDIGLDAKRGAFGARAVRPDGSAIDIEIEVGLSHFSPGGYKAVVRAPGTAKSDLPPGTEIWRRA